MATNDRLIEQIANKISDLGLTAPAVLLLEAHKPLAFLGSQLLLVAQPTLSIFLPHHLICNLIQLFDNPDRLEKLIAAIEAPEATGAVSASATPSLEIEQP